MVQIMFYDSESRMTVARDISITPTIVLTEAQRLIEHELEARKRLDMLIREYRDMLNIMAHDTRER